MLHPLLKPGRSVPDQLVKILKRRVRHVHLARFRRPEGAVPKQAAIARHAACETQPLHVVWPKNIGLKRKIYSGMRRGCRHDCHQVQRKFLQHRPLVEARVRTAPHRHFAVAIRLLREPFHHVVAVLALIHKWLKLPAGISASAHIHEGVHIAMLREIRGAVRVRVSDVWCKCENHRQRLFLTMRREYRRVQLHSVPRRNLHRPLHVNGRLFGGGLLLRARRDRPQQDRQHQSSCSRTDFLECLNEHFFSLRSDELPLLYGPKTRIPELYRFVGTAFICLRIRTRNTFLWFASSTSKRWSSRSILSPGAGTLPDAWLSKPARVVTASSVLSPNFTPSNSSTSPMAMLPRITRPPSASRTTSGAGGLPSFRLSPTISSTRSSTVAMPATVPCSSMITASGQPF